MCSHKCRDVNKAFTLVELLVAMTVVSFILGAIATLAYALSSADNSADDTNYKQAQVRFTTLRIGQLIRDCRMLCGLPDSDLAIWRADDNSDNQININELTFIQKGDDSDFIKLCVFPESDFSVVALNSINSLSPDDYDVTYVTLIPQCSNVQFYLDDIPPVTRFISISFELLENQISQEYQINAVIRGPAFNLLNQTADALTSDDD